MTPPSRLKSSPYVVAILHATKKSFSCNVSHKSTSYLVYLTLVWTRANWWETITPNTKRENGLYPPTQRSFQAFADFEQMF